MLNRCSLSIGVLSALFLASLPSDASCQSASLPQLRRFWKSGVQLSDAQIAALERGEIVTKQLPSADKPEIAAFGAVFVNADKEALLQRLQDIVAFRKGPQILEIGPLSNPPRLEDFASLSLERGDFEAARDCRPGRCDIKLADSAMARIRREIDWSAPNARAAAADLMKRMLLDYATAYMRGGAAEMAVYHDKDAPLPTLDEFRKVLATSPYLVEYVPDLHRYLEDFPKRPLAGATDVFYWAKDKFCPKPTIGLYHVTLWRDPSKAGLTLVASKQFYASHYFRAGLDLTAVVAAPKAGFYLMSLYRTRIDPPTGLLSGPILGKIRGGIEDAVAENLKTAKARAEARGSD
jgi:hypothetical protein